MKIDSSATQNVADDGDRKDRRRNAPTREVRGSNQIPGLDGSYAILVRQKAAQNAGYAGFASVTSRITSDGWA